jgi:hypothetical protein
VTIRQRVKWLVLTLAVIVVLCCLPSVELIRWVGYTDLEIEFIVRDSLTGNPIPGATILVREWPGNQDLKLTTGPDGRVTKAVPNSYVLWNERPEH